MGLPITAEIMQSGGHEAFPLYVWLIDGPDGPVWRELDESFDYWDERTGRGLAFFVDPFQKAAWAADFLPRVVGGDGANAVLAAKRQVQRFFRERLAEAARAELWLPADLLPIAIIGCRWDARKIIVCPLANRRGVVTVLESMSTLGRSWRPLPLYGAPDAPTNQSRWTTGEEAQRLRAVESVLTRAGLASQPRDFRPSSLSRVARETIQAMPTGPFSAWLQSEEMRTSREGALHLGRAVSCAGFAALDDVVALARQLAERTSLEVIARPQDPYVRDVAAILRRLTSLTEKLHALRTSLNEVSTSVGLSEDERLTAGADRVLGLGLTIPALDVDQRLENLLGQETFARLSPTSRSALRASETISALSEAISELHEDMSAVLLGYWKAAEVEGRRLILEIAGRAGGMPVWNQKARAVETLCEPAAIEQLSAGGVGWALVNARFPTTGLWCGLPLAALGVRLQQMSTKARNRFIHREVLDDLAALEHARDLVARPPEGILPIALTCVFEVAGMDAGPEMLTEEHLLRLAREVGKVSKGNAAAAVPSALARLRGAARAVFVQGVVDRLGTGWLHERKRQPWVGELLSARDDRRRPG